MRKFRILGGTSVFLALGAAAAARATAEEILAVTNDDSLISFDSASPGSIDTTRKITQINGNVIAIDVRPADGVLYGLTNTLRLYRIDRTSGVAAEVGTGPITPSFTGRASMNFDPSTDRIRVVTEAGDNFRLNPNDGTVEDGDPVVQGTQFDAQVAYALDDPNATRRPFVVGVAHTSQDPAGRTTSFVLDASLDALAVLGDPDGRATSRDAGILHTVGALGVNAASPVGFDISSATGRAYMVFTPPGEFSSKLYVVSLFTGGSAPVGPVGDLRPLRAIAVGPSSTVPSTPRVDMIGLTLGGELVRFSSAEPATIANRLSVTGLVPGDSLVAIALRPTNKRLYGVSNGGRLYVINALTGVARAVRTTPFEVALEGTEFAFDFNPRTDVARITTSTGQNLRIRPDTGAVIDSDPRTPGVQIDSPVRFADNDPHAGPSATVVAGAFDQNVPARASSFFVIDSNFDVLARQTSVGGSSSANGGILHTVGPLGVDATSVLGFEINGSSTAFAAIATPGGVSSLFSIDLDTGAATFIGSIGSSETIRGIAVAPTSNPPTFGDALRVTAMNVRLDFRAAERDAASIVGSIPFPDQGRAGRNVVVDVGGFTQSFVLGRNGRMRLDEGTRTARDDDTFALLGAPSDGRIRFELALRREQLSDDLADEGLVNADVRGAIVPVRVAITVDGVVYATEVELRYSAHAGRTGVAHRP